MKWIVAFVLLLVMAFCVFGFLASWEPTPGAMYFRVGYAIAGLAVAATIGAILARRRKPA